MLKRIEPLPNWCITDKNPAFYDTESATAIEQTAKLYGAMQKLIDNYNSFANELDNTLNANIDLQDKKIEESIVYIKDNLGVAIEDLLNELVKKGQLKNVITTYEYQSVDERLVLKMGGATNE